MLIKNYKSIFIDQLTPLYDREEASSIFYIILEEIHQIKRIDLALSPTLVFTDKEIAYWNAIVEQVKLEIPIQYILGTTSFYGLSFVVNKNTLIPRPETEELVDLVLKELNKSGKLNQKIVDIGTGSGCIAIALAKNLPSASVTAIDVSKEALEIAQINAVKNKVTIHFSEKDILKTIDLGQQFDCIVSNPPYVRNLEKIEIKKNVLDYEPHLALFVPDEDALLFYRKIATLAKKNLTVEGKLFFEINQYLAKEMKAMVEELGFKNVQIFKDCYGNDRMLQATLI